MKIIIASDIHGNLEYTEKLYEYCSLKDPDKIILLGDILTNYYAPDPFAENEIISIINRWAAITIGVRGNTDRDYDLEKFNFTFADEYEKINIDGIDFYLTHGHLNGKYDYLFKDHYCLMGHTHRYDINGKHLNPGSVGLPRGVEEHTCFYYENHTFSLINLENYDIIAKIVINKS